MTNERTNTAKASRWLPMPRKMGSGSRLRLWNRGLPEGLVEALLPKLL